METNKTGAQNVKDGNAQNAVSETKAVNAEKEQETVGDNKKKQKVSATYTLRACGENAKKLYELELISQEDLTTIIGIQRKALDKYIKAEMGI